MFDLKGRFTFEGADEAVSDLQKINDACQDVEQMAREAATGFDQMGEQIYEGSSRAGMSLSSLEKALGATSAELAEAKSIIGALGMAGLAISSTASKAAMDLEDATTRLKVVVGEDWPAINRAILEEQTRIRYMISEGEMIEALIPIARMLPEDAEILLDLLAPVNEALIVAGVSAEKYSMAWMQISRAIASGSGEALATGSRYMPALFTTPEAIEMLRTMNKEYGAVQNARILASALALQERIEQDKLNAMYDTGASRLRSFSITVGNFMEDFGKGFASVKATWAEVFRGLFQYLLDENVVPALGRFTTIASTMAIAIGGPAVVRTLVSRFLPGLIPTGTSAVWLLGKMALGVGAVALAVEDLWSALQGKESVIGAVVKLVGIDPESLAGLPDWAQQLVLIGASAIAWQIAKAFMAHPGFFLTKVIPGAAAAIGVVIALEPLWSMIPGTEGLEGVVDVIPDTLRAFMTTAGFTWLGFRIGGLPGAAIGLTLGVALTLYYFITKKHEPTAAQETLGEAAAETLDLADKIAKGDFPEDDVQRFSGAWSEALAKAAAEGGVMYERGFGEFANAMTDFSMLVARSYGPEVANRAFVDAMEQVVRGIEDEAARRRVAGDILQHWSFSAEEAERIRRAADRTPPGEPTPGFEEYEPSGEAPVGGVTVNVNIGTGAVQVTGTASVDEATRDEIIQRAVEAVAEGMRAVLDESPRGA
jgi:hypothetical protein